jgi:hypothetical protein
MAAGAVASMTLGGFLIATATTQASRSAGGAHAGSATTRPRHAKASPARTHTPALAPPPVAAGSVRGPDLAADKPMSAYSFAKGHAPPAAVDGNPATYWESAVGTFPQWLQVDLTSPMRIGAIRLSVPASGAWPARTQTLSISGSENGTSWLTIAGLARYTFNPATGNMVTIKVSPVTVRYIKLIFTGNTALRAAQLAELNVYPSGP